MNITFHSTQNEQSKNLTGFKKESKQNVHSFKKKCALEIMQINFKRVSLI